MITLDEYRDPIFVMFCQGALDNFLAETHGVITALVATPDGFSIACASKDDKTSVDNLSAVGSTLFSLGSSVASQLNQGLCNSVTIDNEKGKVYISSVTDGSKDRSLILFIQTTQQAMLAHILHGSRKLSENLAKRLITLG